MTSSGSVATRALLPPDSEAAMAAAAAARSQGRAGEAIALLDQAAVQWPRQADIHFQRGYTLRGLGRHEEALAAYDEAVRLSPRSASAQANRANTLSTLGRNDEAREAYERALALDPGHAVASHGLGVLLFQQGEAQRALPHLERAVQAAPADPKPRLHLAIARLLQGDYERGLPDYEARWPAAAREHMRHFPQPLWLGDRPLQGRTILLHGEQGLGDTLQFCRYARLVRGRGARVVLEAHRPLLPLLRTLEGVDQLVALGDPLPAFDLHCPLGSLPLAVRTTPATIPWTGAYLRADPGTVERWRPRLGANGALRIGIAWSGSRNHAQDATRTIPLAQVLRHLPPGPAYVSLQQEVRDEDRAALAARPDVLHFGAQLRDFGDTAALCELVHLVVSVDTSVAHLAGALGRDLRLLLPAAPDWRWFREREDTPWYASARLYRQQRIGRWDEPLARLAAQLFPAANPNPNP